MYAPGDTFSYGRFVVDNQYASRVRGAPGRDDRIGLGGAVWTVMNVRWVRAVLCGLAGGCVALGVSELSRPAPVKAFADKKTAGAELFATRGCAHCHGNDGQGTDRAPALRELRKKLSAAKINDQIVHGGQGMPAFGDSLQPNEVDELVEFLRAKKWITPPAAKEPAQPAKPAPETPGL